MLYFYHFCVPEEKNICQIARKGTKNIILKEQLIKWKNKDYIAFIIISNFQLLLICYHFFVHKTIVNN